MLFDPKWEKVTAKPFTVKSLIAWLEMQPGDGEYCYSDSGTCMLARYANSLGYDSVVVGGLRITHRGRNIAMYNYEMVAAIATEPRTYGAALNRVRAHAFWKPKFVPCD